MIVFLWERDLFSSKNCLFSSKEEIKTRTFIVIKNITPSSYRAFDWKEQILVLALVRKQLCARNRVFNHLEALYRKSLLSIVLNTASIVKKYFRALRTFD